MGASASPSTCDKCALGILLSNASYSTNTPQHSTLACAPRQKLNVTIGSMIILIIHRHSQQQHRQLDLPPVRSLRYRCYGLSHGHFHHPLQCIIM